MKQSLTKKVGPLPTWAWIALVGGGAGVFLLWRKSKAAGKIEEGSLPIPSGFTANPPEGSASGGGGGEVKSSGEGPGNNASAPSSTTATPVSDFLTTERELHGGGWEREAEFLVTHPVQSTAPAVSTALKTAKGGTPGRGGTLFKAGTYKGHAAHIYAKAVKGGIGPGKNVIVLAPSHGRSAPHSKAGDHSPAHVKGSTTHHKAAAKKPPTKHAAKPKPKPRKRR